MLRKGEVFAAAPPHIAYCPPQACHLTHPAHLPPAQAAAHRTPHTSPDSWPPPAAHRTGHNRRPACSASAPRLFPRCRARRFPVARRTLRSLAHRNRRPRFTLPATLRPLWRPTAPPCCSAPFRRVLPRPPCCRCTSPTLSASAPRLFSCRRARRFPVGARLSHARCPPGRTTAPLPCRPRLMPPHTVPRLMPTACTSTAQPPPAEPTAGAHRCPLPPAHARCPLPAAPAALL